MGKLSNFQLKRSTQLAQKGQMCHLGAPQSVLFL